MKDDVVEFGFYLMCEGGYSYCWIIYVVDVIGYVVFVMLLVCVC